MHIAVVGLGPAGSLLAHRAVHRGWTVDGYDPACGGTDIDPSLPSWRSTWGLPVAALPDWARDVIPFAGLCEDLRAYTPALHRLDYGRYGVIDRSALRSRLSPGIRLHRQRVDTLTARALGVDAVIDCRGVIDRPGSIRQVAYGLFLPVDIARDAGISPGVFMDWRPAPGASADRADPGFLYVQSTGDSVLVEETVLATRTPTRELLPTLKARLHARLGPVVESAIGSETVHFPIDRRRRPWYLGADEHGTATFGAAGGLTHPATGYSVAAAAAAADTALDQLVEGVAHRGRWSAALAWRLRLLGSELIVRAGDGDVLPRFFDAFFRLPPGLQRGYLDGQNAAPVAAAMVSLAAFPRQALPFLRPLPTALRYTLKPR